MLVVRRIVLLWHFNTLKQLKIFNGRSLKSDNDVTFRSAYFFLVKSSSIFGSCATVILATPAEDDLGEIRVFVCVYYKMDRCSCC